MAAPLSGIGQQQQVPLSQPFQPGANDQTRQVRQQEQQPRENEVQARGAAPAQSQESSAENSLLSSNFSENLARVNSDPSQSETRERGTVVDITI